MATAEKPTGFPTPPAWLTIIISVGLSYGATKYDQGRLAEQVAANSKYIEDDRKTKEQQRLALEARYLAAEAARNSQKDSEVQELRQTTEALKALLNNRANGTKP